MAYLISDEAKDLLKDLKKFCDNEVREQAKEFDKSGEWPKDRFCNHYLGQRSWNEACSYSRKRCSKEKTV